MRTIMLWIEQLIRKLRHLTKEKSFNEELDEEMNAHLEIMIEENMKDGMSPEKARKEAFKRFGNVEALKESCDESWGVRILSDLNQDLKFATRKIKKHFLFSIAAVLSLGIGIGSVTALFSIFNTVRFQTLPVPEAENLREIRVINPRVRSAATRGNTQELPGGRRMANVVNYRTLLEFQKLSPNIGEVLGFAEINGSGIRVNEQSAGANAMMVSGNFFSGLQVDPLFGRNINVNDDKMGAAQVAVISYNYWKQHFSDKTTAVGSILYLNKIAFEIIGVLPEGFNGPLHVKKIGVYIPLAMQPLVHDLQLMNETHFWISPIVRLTTPITENAAKSYLTEALERSLPIESLQISNNSSGPRQVIIESRGGISSTENSSSNVSSGPPPPLFEVRFLEGKQGVMNQTDRFEIYFNILIITASLILLAACSNLAGMLLARGIASKGETTTKLALGAGKIRVMRQSLIESAILSISGGILGWLILLLGKSTILKTYSSVYRNLELDGPNDYRVLLFGIAATLLAGFVFGITPAIQSYRTNLIEGMRSKNTRIRWFNVGPLFVSSQIAFATLLIICTLLVSRSIHHLNNIELGYAKENVMSFQLVIHSSVYKPTQIYSLMNQVTDSLSMLPGVSSVSSSDVPLLSGMRRTGQNIVSMEVKETEDIPVRTLTVTEHFLDTVGMSLVDGRGFLPTDTPESEPVVIINETFAKTFFTTPNPINKHFRLRNRDYRVVGIVKDFKYEDLRMENGPAILLCASQTPPNRFRTKRLCFQLKTHGDDLQMAKSITEAIRKIDSEVPLRNLRTIETKYSDSISREKFAASLLFFFSAIGIILSFIGIYSLISFTVNQRLRDIGIRRALGANFQQSIAFIFKSSMVMIFIGLLIGTATMAIVGKHLTEYLYEVEVWDAYTLIITGASVFTISAFATIIPSIRASRIHPMDTLRYE
ncbi:MAG: ABC transporter permease [Opitutales bacterium]|nr:ABC transporter permease [Opitutales bacterium]